MSDEFPPNVEPAKPPMKRGNEPLPVAGKERARVPDAHDVVVGGKIVFRHHDADIRERVRKEFEDGVRE